jgi:hypothetical protein
MLLLSVVVQVLLISGLFLFLHFNLRQLMFNLYLALLRCKHYIPSFLKLIVLRVPLVREVAAPPLGCGGCLRPGVNFQLRPRIIDYLADQEGSQRFQVPVRPYGGDVREELSVLTIGQGLHL